MSDLLERIRAAQVRAGEQAVVEHLREKGLLLPIEINRSDKQMAEAQDPSAWYEEVVRICQERGYARWFYADRDAWLEDFTEFTPEEAVEYNVECLR